MIRSWIIKDCDQLKRPSLSMILVVVFTGYFLGLLLQNLVWGYLVGLVFWIMGWTVTRSPNNNSFPRIATEKRKNALTQKMKTLTNVQLSLFNNDVILVANGKWITATALFQIKEPLTLEELTAVQKQLQEENIPLFTYSILGVKQNEQSNDHLRWGITMFLGIRISQKTSRTLNNQQFEILSSKAKMGASRIIKALQQNTQKTSIRRLEDIELMRAIKGIIFAPSTEKMMLKNLDSLWIELENNRR